MYLIINNETYTRAARAKGARRISYLAADLPEGLAAEGEIRVFRDDGFLLCTDAVSAYARQVSAAGSFTLTNEPEPVPEPAPAPVEPRVTWGELAAAIAEGVESV